MSRKFDRREQINRTASTLVAQMLADPRFMAQLFRPKPRFVPRWLWKLLFRTLVITK
jgi:hypothetical protein